MSSQTPDSSFPEQGNSPEVAERSEVDVAYLSPDTDLEEEESTFATGTPGFASITSLVQSAYGFQNTAFESRNEEIETMTRLVNPEEDRKLPLLLLPLLNKVLTVSSSMSLKLKNLKRKQ